MPQAIEGYRETEKSHWSAEASPIISRLREAAAGAVQGRRLAALPEVHVLDLAKEGYIRPHIDSVKVATQKSCKATVFGYQCLLPSLSLSLSPAVLRGGDRWCEPSLSLRDDVGIQEGGGGGREGREGRGDDGGGRPVDLCPPTTPLSLRHAVREMTLTLRPFQGL